MKENSPYFVVFISRVCTYLKNPWQSLNFEISVQDLESLWKLQSVLESPWISVLALSNPDSQVTKRSKHKKTFRIKLLMLWKNLKWYRLKALFCTKWSPWKMGNVSLKCPWIFCSKKSTNLVYPNHFKSPFLFLIRNIQANNDSQKAWHG